MTLESGGGSPSVSISSDNSGQGNQNSGSSGGSSAENSSQAGDFLSALNQDNRQYFEKKGWKDVNAAIQSYRELERSSSQQRGAAQKSPAANGEVVPTSPAGYEFTLPKDLPSEGFYDQKFAETFKGIAHKAGLLPGQAQALHDFWVNNALEAHKSNTTASANSLNEKISGAHDALVKEWGEANTPQFSRNVELAKRAIRNLDPDLKSELKKAGVLIDHKGQEVVANAAIFKALAKAGASMFAEDDVFGTVSAADNPFDPKNASPQAMTRQGELIKKDPELARTLIQAAGPAVVKEWHHFLNKKQR
jgi:hypothetical protein